MRKILPKVPMAESQFGRILLSHVLCDKINGSPVITHMHVCETLFFSHIYIRKRKHTNQYLYFFPNKHEKKVKGGLVATQDLP